MDEREIVIPGSVEHCGLHSMRVRVPWVCLHCGGPRGEPTAGLSYDGSRRLNVDTWQNPCGHVETYSAIRAAIAKATA